MHFVFSLALVGFGQHKFEKQFGSSCHGLGWSIQVKMHFVSSLALDKFGQYVAICILVLAGEGEVCSTHIEILFMF
jgi:hypothetical protein